MTNFIDKSKTGWEYTTIVELLRDRALHQPESEAFTFLKDEESTQETLTYQQLDRCSRAIAMRLQAMGMSGERALLLYPPGLDYIAAFFGCLYAGVIAVPAYPPRNERNKPRIQAIATDCRVAIALTITKNLSSLQSLLPENLQWLTTDDIDISNGDSWHEIAIAGDSLAFLQYTSGSTGTPKGVMLSHGNLMHNAATTYQLMGHSAASKFVSWLPMYHDMGLIGGILQPLYGGFPCILMSPASFLQRPYRWLQAISNYKGTTSGAPNFAYELCIQKITPEQKSSLDLSSWTVAFNGAEPIRGETFERFATAFADCGFRKEAFYPCYGMAEATLMVSGGTQTALPKVKTIAKSALERNLVIDSRGDGIQIVGCGQTIPQQQIVIVHPETLKRCQPNEIGEIWVSGASVGHGYWNRSEETEQTFRAHLAGTDEGSFLRTGDLGFLDNGELYVTGRVKDLIIIRGRNLYPQDIELTAERSHSSLRWGSNAAFSIEVDNEERLAIAQELEFRAKPDFKEVTAAIRQAVFAEHEIQVHAVVLIEPGSIPKTSSGKIQRRATRAKFLAGELDVIASNVLSNADAALTAFSEECPLLLEEYLQKQVARVLHLSPDAFDSQQPFSSLGIDSLKAFELKNAIEVDLKVSVSVADLFDGIDTRSLAAKILEQLADKTAIPSLPLTKVSQTATSYPLSFAQQRLWFIERLVPNNPAYNIPIEIELTGQLDVTILTQCLNEIVKRHEALRTNFVLVEGQPVQIVNPSVELTLFVEDLRDCSERDTLQQIAKEFAQQPFDLSGKLLLRAKLLRLGESNYRLLVVIHHIVADGWSIGIFMRELAALYEAFSQGKPSPLSPLTIQYADFTIWQQQWLQGGRLQTLLNYWKQQLSGTIPVLNLPVDRRRSPVPSFKGDRVRLVLPHTLTRELKDLSHQEGATLFATLLASFKVLLYRYTGQTDIAVGSPIASRNRAEIEALIGFFVNVLVLRTDLANEPSFKELLARVRKVALDACDRQDLPFEKLVEEIQPERDLSHHPLFQVMFVFQNMPIPQPKLANLSMTCREGDSGTAKFDLTLYVEEQESTLTVTLEYNADLFDRETMTRMLGHFQTLLESIVTNPHQCISHISILTQVEREQLQAKIPSGKAPLLTCIPSLFERQVAQTPDAIAVVCEHQQLTYSQLNAKANQIAHSLQQFGIAPSQKVGLCVERSLEMVIAIVGILKAGAAYVPLDPTYPDERLHFILEDAQVSLVLTQKSLQERFIEKTIPIVSIEEISSGREDNPNCSVTADDIAYIIYTSGSTGKPKGVICTHHNVVRLFETTQPLYKFDRNDVWTLFHSIAFDFSVWELWGALLYGGRLVVVPYSVSRNPESFYDLLDREGVTVLNQTPSAFRQLMNVEKSRDLNLRFVIFGGEALDVQSLKPWLDRHGDETPQLINMYGITETTVHVTYRRITIADLENRQGNAIGRPLDDLQVYILDRYLQPVPIGIAGEICVGGAGLAKGYLNREELNAAKFIANPFGGRLYRSGDLGRYLSNGELEYLGRIDNQVKIRGFRIELGEIEALLGQHPQVRETVVIVKEERSGDRRLVAYVVGDFGDDAIATLPDYLKEKLPAYAIPSAFVLLDALPLTPNGKVDRRALPAPSSSRPTLVTDYQAPQSAIEQTIARVWQEVLNLEKVGVHDNFFDLGGHSLSMVRVNNQLRTMLQRDLSVVAMFQHPTIHSLTQYLSQTSEIAPFVTSLRDRTRQQIEAINRQKRMRAGGAEGAGGAGGDSLRLC